VRINAEILVLWQKILEVRKSWRSKIVYATTGKMSAINYYLSYNICLTHSYKFDLFESSS
jgi:hypothetical protein